MTTRRSLLTGGAGLILTAVPACAQTGAQTEERVGQGLRLKTSDYATDRAKYQTRLTYRGPSPQPPRILPKPPADIEVVTFASGALTLKGWLGRPAPRPDRPADTKTPVVVFLHGGFAFGADDFDMARPFIEAGYAVFVPILRGENGQPGHYSFFYDEVDDVIAAARRVSGFDWVDPKRIYLAGHSVGGTLTMLAGQASALFRAVASFSGSADQIAFARGEPGIVPFDPKDLTELEMRSPMAYARSFKSPARLYYGASEDFFSTSTPLTAKLAKAAGLDVEALAVPGDHFGAVPREIALAIAFFQAHG